jgi:hypothetical protein
MSTESNTLEFKLRLLIEFNPLRCCYYNGLVNKI